MNKSIKEVATNIFQIRIILGLPHTEEVFLYFIRDNYPTLIDSGPGYGLTRVIRSKLSKIGFDIRNLYYVINTHEHPEHFGGNKELKEINNNIKICAHRVAQLGMKNIEYRPPKELLNVLGTDGYNTLDRYAAQFEEIAKLGIDLSLEDDQIIVVGNRKIRVIHTPGHSPGHICLLLEEENILFSGDCIIGEGTPYVGSISSILREKKDYNPGGDMKQYIDSLNKLKQLNIDTILPAHGPICDKSKIDDTIEHKLTREKKLISILKNNKRLTLEELTKRLYDETIFSNYLTGATYAYIKKLIQENKINKIKEEDSIYFELNE